MTHLYAPSAAWLTDAHRTEPCPWSYIHVVCNHRKSVVPQPLTAPHPIPQGATVEYVVACAQCFERSDAHHYGHHDISDVRANTCQTDPKSPESVAAIEHVLKAVAVKLTTLPAIVGRSVVTACDPTWAGDGFGWEFSVEVSPVEWYSTPHTAMACPECGGTRIKPESDPAAWCQTCSSGPMDDPDRTISGRVPVPTLTEGLWL